MTKVPYPRAMQQFPSLRQSTLSTFDSCGLTARFDQLYRSGWSQPWQARGQLFHRMAGEALREMHRMREPKIPVDAALAILNEVLRQETVDRVCPFCSSSRIRKGVTKKGMRSCLACRRQFETELVNIPMHEVSDLYWVTKKWAHDNEFDIRNLVSIEDRLKAKLAYPNPFGGIVEREVSGQLDALLLDSQDNTHAIVLDWKDMWGVPAPTDVSFGGYFQQRFYAMLVMLNFKQIEKVTLREFYVRFSVPREATIYRADLADIVANMSALVERFDRAWQERTWVATPGQWCGFCQAPQKCPILPEGRGDGEVTSPEMAAVIAGQLIVGERVVKSRRQALQAWVAQHGPVRVRDAKGERWYGYRAAERTMRPTAEEIENAQHAIGRPLTKKEIEGLYRKVPGTRFEMFTTKPQPPETERDEELIEQLQQSLQQATVGARS